MCVSNCIRIWNGKGAIVLSFKGTSSSECIALKRRKP